MRKWRRAGWTAWFGFVQGFNAQAAVNEQHIVLAAEITTNSTDFSQLSPMITAILGELERAGVDQLPEAVAADAGYWNEEHMDGVVANKHIPVLVAPTRAAAERRARGGQVGGMNGCEPCSAQTTDGSGTRNANRPPNQRSVTPNTTKVSSAFTDEAGSKCAPSGD